MSYEWQKTPSNGWREGIEVGGVKGQGWINVFSEGEQALADLPADSDELKCLLNAILEAAGMQDMDQDWMPEPR